MSEILNKFVEFINGIIEAIKNLVAQIRDYNDKN